MSALFVGMEKKHIKAKIKKLLENKITKDIKRYFDQEEDSYKAMIQ